MNTNGDVNEATRPRDLIRHLSGHPGAPRQIADIVLHGLSVVLHGGWWLHFRRRAGRPGRRLRTILSRMVSELLLFEAARRRKAFWDSRICPNYTPRWRRRVCAAKLSLNGPSGVLSMCAQSPRGARDGEAEPEDETNSRHCPEDSIDPRARSAREPARRTGNLSLMRRAEGPRRACGSRVARATPEQSRCSSAGPGECARRTTENASPPLTRGAWDLARG